MGGALSLVLGEATARRHLSPREQPSVDTGAEKCALLLLSRHCVIFHYCNLCTVSRELDFACKSAEGFVDGDRVYRLAVSVAISFVVLIHFLLMFFVL